MITDTELYKLAIFLGSCAMLLIVLYHFLEVNSQENNQDTVVTPSSLTKGPDKAQSTLNTTPTTAKTENC
ncbi:hypothetical protein CISG_04255 [Coccidioides immitis RMSCC 3703]|uniref:Dolichyl-diphosphooligosaccharide--protein glycosyltransferase subunit 4 n=2 Tax=Coccidioides immitis TaxID=5501 RepID=A0A0J8QTF1_COCIT|nr:hypothetical protein CIRG_02315 [Coccidioides immitis RMSCC 2394]KMU74548.1 hypothetical protein CISG_04255 [Coccidioides immitis RMSCC 3703]